MIGTGLVAHAVPIARAAFGCPTLAASAAVGHDVAGPDLGAQQRQRRAAEVRAHEREVDRQVEALVDAVEVGRDDVARGAQLAVGGDDPRPQVRRDLREQRVDGLPGEPDAHHAALALHDQELPDRRVEARVDGVGETLAHGGGGDRVQQAGGKGHAGIPWVRRVRIAVETRWRAATAEQPSRAAMPS